MLFGSAVLFAILSGSFWPGAPARPSSAALSAVSASMSRPEPPPTINLRLLEPPKEARDPSKPPIELKSLIGKLPLEVKSQKVVGASGFGVFVPLNHTISVGAGVTAFKTAPHERALQGVIGIRFKF
jgi:hypothetical protein